MEKAPMMIANLPLSIENILFIAEVVFNRIRVRFSSNAHPFDPAFVSGDAFRSLADHIFEKGTTFDPAKVQPRDFVFVDLSYIDAYFESLHPQIQVPYRLLSHNGDTNITKRFLSKIDAKILVWWTQNCLITHPKVHAIPIGIENISYYNHGIPSLFRMKKTQKKKPAIVFGFSISTNRAARTSAHAILQKIPLAESFPARLNSRQYIKALGHYQFVASPPGNGEDCIRTWEAMYVRVVPIVLRSTLTKEFEKLRLPIWLIDDWKELASFSSKDLQRKYDTIMKRSDKTSLQFAYWKSRILRTYAK